VQELTKLTGAKKQRGVVRLSDRYRPRTMGLRARDPKYIEAILKGEKFLDAMDLNYTEVTDIKKGDHAIYHETNGRLAENLFKHTVEEFRVRIFKKTELANGKMKPQEIDLLVKEFNLNPQKNENELPSK
jgi:hypothetical protein